MYSRGGGGEGGEDWRRDFSGYQWSSWPFQVIAARVSTYQVENEPTQGMNLPVLDISNLPDTDAGVHEK